MVTKRKRFNEGDVIVIEGRPALITRIGGDGSIASCTTVDYSYIGGDGELMIGGHFNGEYQMEDVAKVDFATVRTVVDLPPDLKANAHVFELKQQEKRKLDRQRMGESDPETHPSYGNIQVNRVSGHMSLFASPFKHMHFMRLTIKRSSRRRSLNRDWNYGDGTTLVEINLSEAQWAHMVSSASVGGGVPCTISRVGGQQMEKCPEQEEIEWFHSDLEQTAEKAAAFMNEAMDLMQALVDDKAPSKEKRKAVLEKISRAQRQLNDSAPFVARQLRERMDTIIQEGKTELEAYAHNTIIESGIAQLAETMGKDSKVLGLEPLNPSKPHPHSCEANSLIAREEAQTSGPPISIYRCRICGKEST